MATAIRLPRVVSSPSTIQFHAREPKPYYKPRFTLTKETREKTLNQPWLHDTDPMMPPYPYGKNQTFREANQGLYGGSTIQSGHNISKGRNKGKTLRKWFPNVRVEKIRSEALDKELTIPITARTLRTINKCGGLDQYLLGDKPARIKELGLLGWKLRWLVMNSESMQEKYATERANLGLPLTPKSAGSFAEAWNNPEQREEMIAEQTEAWNELRERAKKFPDHVQKNWNYLENVKYPKTLLGTLHTQSPETLQLPDVVEEKEMVLPVRIKEAV